MPKTLSLEAAEKSHVFDGLNALETSLFMEAIARLKSDTVAGGFDEIDNLLGQNFTETERLKLELDSLVESFKYRRTLLKDSISASDVAHMLGVSRQTPHDRVKAQTLLAVMDNGVLKFPLWQFNPEGSNGVIEGLPEVLKALTGSDFSKLSWLVRMNPFLGFTPIEALQRGLKAQVIEGALAVGYGQN